MLHQLLFGKWQDKSIESVADLKVPGLYFLAARTFGFKGLIGGTHSWLTHVADDMTHTVIEVTDIETLLMQGVSIYYTFTGMPNYMIDYREQLVFVSDRKGCQRWFGHAPKVTYLGNIDLDIVLDWTQIYPKISDRFNVLTSNCNTFTSWILHILGIEFRSGFGAKNWSKTAK
jgi:hypothetical protein